MPGGVAVDGFEINRLRPRLLDPRRCLECYIHARVEKAPPSLRPRLLHLLEEAETRTRLFVESYTMLYGSEDPYRGEKEKLNKVFLGLLPELREALEDPVRGLLLLAWANSIDIPYPWYKPEPPDPNSLDTMTAPAGDWLHQLVEEARSLALVLDNAGEAVVDLAYALLAAEHGLDVVVYARSQPYEVDVTAREAEELLQAVAETLKVKPRVEVRGTGSAYPAPAVEEVARELNGYDLVVLKGIANLEALAEYRTLNPEKTVVLFRAKCPVLASIFGVRLLTPIATHGAHVLEVLGG